MVVKTVRTVQERADPREYRRPGMPVRASLRIPFALSAKTLIAAARCTGRPGRTCRPRGSSRTPLSPIVRHGGSYADASTGNLFDVEPKNGS
jgi:hypothetical protein